MSSKNDEWTTVERRKKTKSPSPQADNAVLPTASPSTTYDEEEESKKFGGIIERSVPTRDCAKGFKAESP
jgi:hypothetical protein